MNSLQQQHKVRLRGLAGEIVASVGTPCLGGDVRAPFTQLYVHLVWSTWDRLPMLTPGLTPQVYACIQAECTALRVDLVAIGGIEDHVHVLVRMPPSIATSYLVQQLKGVSSHLANHAAASEYVFKWQGGYGAFSVSKRSIAEARDYILNQEERHRTGRLYRALEPGSGPGHSRASA